MRVLNKMNSDSLKVVLRRSVAPSLVFFFAAAVAAAGVVRGVPEPLPSSAMARTPQLRSVSYTRDTVTPAAEQAEYATTAPATAYSSTATSATATAATAYTTDTATSATTPFGAAGRHEADFPPKGRIARARLNAQPALVTPAVEKAAAPVFAATRATPEPGSADPAPATAARSAAAPWVGFYVPGAPKDLAGLTSIESKIGAKAKVVNFFISDSESFPLSRVQSAAAHGSTPLVTLEFWSAKSGGLSAISDGSKDAYLRKFADEAKAYGGTIWLRPFHEMNGNWYPWAGTEKGNSAAELIAAWKHVHGIFAERGADNVKFVWCPNNDSVPSTDANAIEKYWPGDAYVDYVAIDGYNWGTSASWSKWRTFGSVFGESYATVTKLTKKPLFVAETGCADVGGSKADWIAEMFGKIASTYPRITGVVWFQVDKECDWRIDSSADAVQAFRSATGGN